ncbi:MAG: hypothetical protein CL946_06580 [Ectothiorhodospiraceae bacterium]|nr:hypothetical protein [Ectothiorhodospiraceae bacterium]
MTLERISALSPADWYDAFTKHLYWSQNNNRISGNPAWDAEGLNVIGIRCNPLEDFFMPTRTGKEEWNDALVLIEGTRIEVFACTTDPAVVRVNPIGIAHLNEGCWDSYVRGNHRSAWRKALVQRKGPVRVTRTDSRGNVKMHEWGYFGINVHNAMSWRKPSAGCTVIKPDRIMGLKDKAYIRFRDMLMNAPSRNSRTYALMNRTQLRGYGYDV